VPGRRRLPLHPQRDITPEPPQRPAAGMDFGEDENRSLPAEGTRRGDIRGADVSWVLAMRVINEALNANRLYAKRFQSGDLPMPPRRKIAILVCMDARLTVEPMLGLKPGEAAAADRRCCRGASPFLRVQRP